MSIKTKVNVLISKFAFSYIFTVTAYQRIIRHRVHINFHNQLYTQFKFYEQYIYVGVHTYNVCVYVYTCVYSFLVVARFPRWFYAFFLLLRSIYCFYAKMIFIINWYAPKALRQVDVSAGLWRGATTSRFWRKNAVPLLR